MSQVYIAPIVGTPVMDKLPVRFVVRMLWITRQRSELLRYLLTLPYRKARVKRCRDRQK